MIQLPRQLATAHPQAPSALSQHPAPARCSTSLRKCVRVTPKHPQHHHRGACSLLSALLRATMPSTALVAAGHLETAGQPCAFQRKAGVVITVPTPLRRFSRSNEPHFPNEVLALLSQQVAFHRELCCLARIPSALTGAVRNKNSK